MATYQSVILAKSPRAYWRMNEPSGTNCADSSGNGFDATASGSFSRGASAVIAGGDTSTSFGQSLLDKAQTGAGAVSGGRSAFSLEAWINTTFNDTAAGILVADDVSTRLFQFRIASGALQFIPFDTGGSAQGRTSTRATLLDGAHHHVVVTMDGTQVVFYIDSVSETPQAASFSLNNVSSVVAISGTNGASVHGLGGLIGEAAIYYRTLSQAEVTENYNAGLGIFPSTDLLLPPPVRALR